MATRRRRPTDFRDYRSVLYSDGDLSIGAYARAQRRRQILIALVGVGLIGAAVWLYVTLRTSADAVDSLAPMVNVQCIAPGCGYRGMLPLRATEEFPLRCPQCRQNSCRPLWQCRDCGEQFLPRGRQPELVCPHCGSRRVGISEVVPEPADDR